jgi:hypothetical protein
MRRPVRPRVRTRAPAASVAAALTALTVLAVLAGVGAAPPGTAAGTGWVRLAHFSPDTPKVDVYLGSFSAPARPTVFPSVGYGALSEYSPLPAGRYTISMRAAGAPADSPPVITTDVRVAAGKAYTVAGLGRNASLALRVLGDDLSTPPQGSARMRVIQASAKAPVLTVAETGGSPLVESARFATASPYVNVPAGAKSLAFTAVGANRPVTSARLAAASGAVYSLVVLDGAKGVNVVIRKDATSAARAPSGGVATGLGGTAQAGTAGTGTAGTGTAGTGTAGTVTDRVRAGLLGLALLFLGGGGVLALRPARARERVRA